MTSERPKLTNPEVQRAENFLNEIYGQISSWLRMDRNAQVIREFGSEEIDHWETQSTYPPGTVTLGMDLKRAIVLRDQRNTYGIALGRRAQSRYDKEEDPTLQFGFLPGFDWNGKRPFNDTDTGKLRLLVSPSPFHNTRAEFYYRSDLNRLAVDCWINSAIYGGRDIGRWDESALSPKGETAVVQTIKRLVRNFDPI